MTSEEKLEQDLASARTQLSQVRRQLESAQVSLTAATSKLSKVESELSTIRDVVRPTGRLIDDVSAVVSYARVAASVEHRVTESIATLRVSSDLEARAIGNSLEALFRAVQVPEVIARR